MFTQVTIGLIAFVVSMLSIYAMGTDIETMPKFLVYQNAVILLTISWLVLSGSRRS
jgi:hypothetical protein